MTSPSSKPSRSPFRSLYSKPDAELVLAAQRGDVTARDELARRLRRPAYALSLQLAGSADDALDLTQESLLKFFGSLSRFDATRPVLPWLYQIVRNRFRDLKRRGYVRRRELLESSLVDGLPDMPSSEPGPEGNLESRELRRRLWSELSEMSDAYREILVLRDYHDLSYSEISEVLGVATGTVMSRLHRARRELARRLSLQPIDWERSGGTP